MRLILLRTTNSNREEYAVYQITANKSVVSSILLERWTDPFGPLLIATEHLSFNLVLRKASKDGWWRLEHEEVLAPAPA